MQTQHTHNDSIATQNSCGLNEPYNNMVRGVHWPCGAELLVLTAELLKTVAQAVFLSTIAYGIAQLL